MHRGELKVDYLIRALPETYIRASWFGKRLERARLTSLRFTQLVERNDSAGKRYPALDGGLKARKAALRRLLIRFI